MQKARRVSHLAFQSIVFLGKEDEMPITKTTIVGYRRFLEIARRTLRLVLLALEILRRILDLL